MTLIPTKNLPDVSVLNCGAGDLTFSFDESKPDEVKRAKKVVSDMLKQGYLLFAMVDGEQRRVTKFDAKTCEYIVTEPSVTETKSPKKRGRPPGKRVPARGTPVTSVAPRAGG